MTLNHIKNNLPNIQDSLEAGLIITTIINLAITIVLMSSLPSIIHPLTSTNVEFGTHLIHDVTFPNLGLILRSTSSLPLWIAVIVTSNTINIYDHIIKESYNFKMDIIYFFYLFI